MGQDSEQAAEFVATVRGEHVAMKTWYNDNAKALKEKYGPYPGLWKEVLNWPGWKEARKQYLKSKEPQIPRKRKSRWGSSNDNDANKRSSSRWANNTSSSSAQNVILPGMATNLSPEKQQEMKRLQARLREINDKMANLEREAARVDALPRGHRERSPSPPPSK